MNKTGGRKKMFITVSRCSAPSQHLLRPLFWGKNLSILRWALEILKKVPQLFKNESEENQRRYHHLNICEPALERGGKREEFPPAFYEYRELLSGNVCTKKSTINYSAWEIPKSKSKIRHVSLCNLCCCSLQPREKSNAPLIHGVWRMFARRGSFFSSKERKGLTGKTYSTEWTIWCKHSAVQFSVFRIMHLHDLIGP